MNSIKKSSTGIHDFGVCTNSGLKFFQLNTAKPHIVKKKHSLFTDYSVSYAKECGKYKLAALIKMNTTPSTYSIPIVSTKKR
jgi:hypothetical protein